MEFLKYEGGEMKNGIWYENGEVYEKYGDDDHRATVDKLLKVTVYCDDGSYELPVGLFLSCLGSPFFIWMLISKKKKLSV